MKLKFLFLLIFLIYNQEASFCQKHEVAFTLDDLPVVGYANTSKEHHLEIINKLIATFLKHKIPAIGFVNEGKLYNDIKPDSFAINLLKIWLINGYDLGNHSYSHMDYHKVSLSDFTNDILKGEIICKEMTRSYNKQYKYFRHPYLHVGVSKESYDSLQIFLNNNNYLEAPVTIDNEDYLFAAAYSKALKKQDYILMKKIGEAYIDYMEKMLKYYTGKSEMLFGRNIKHILLLHSNALNADYLDALAEMYSNKNYSFISLEEALKDDIYKSDMKAFGKWGISWIERWTLNQNNSGNSKKDHPVTPGFIKELVLQKE